KSWSECARAMMELDQANIKRWKEDIDTLLVFAGLFSSVVTGFLVESVKSLRPEPLAATVVVLERISAQLRNSSGDITEPTEEPFVPTRHNIEINGLWFASLILSLGVAFVGILVKQWLGDYSRGLLT
ncbi:hypothetical protein BD309DRAFT_837246, partial [Dichomitus squalens]|uniref:uncharacterized protein n=1 Tax=Dichomitus squalens (strain LYAD-421) TaxID=732165 RepID=UPI0004413F3A